MSLIMFTRHWNKFFGHCCWPHRSLISHCVSLYLHSCVVTQRENRSLFRFSLEQLMTDQSDHILSIRYTGTELQYFSI